MFCYILEVIGLFITYCKDFYKTYKHNYCNFVSVVRENKITLIKQMDILVGDLIIINKNSIIPVDCILFSVDDGDYTTISLSNLNGECNIISREPIENKNNYFESFCMKIFNIVDYPNSIKLFEADCIINNTTTKIKSINFIPGGSINKGGTCVMLVTQIGKFIRSYTSSKNEKLYKYNFIDNYITYSLTNYFVYLLALYIITIVYNTPRSSFILIDTIKTFIQAWIILNGIVPFSIKIILMINRQLQSYLYSTSLVEYNSPDSLDNFYQIDHIICDKTGTITKNELLLTHISYLNNIYIEVYDNIPFDILSKVTLGLHYKNKIFSTEEDKVISEKIISQGISMVRNKDMVKISDSLSEIDIEIIEMDLLSFDCMRKLSSVIYKNNNEYFIVTKGSIDAVKNLICKNDLALFNTIYEKYNISYPYLRTIAFAYKKIIYTEGKNPLDYEKEGKYTFLTILGIQDEIQSGVNLAIKELQKQGKKISICTGDRYETAIYIADTLQLLHPTISINTKLNTANIRDKTFIFNSHDIKNALANYEMMQIFKIFLLNSHNAVGYSLIPKDKQFITNIFEGNNIHTISVGDGTNDIPMLKNSTIGISIKNGHNENVVINSEFAITLFSDILKVSDDSKFSFFQNYKAITAIFFKTILIHTLIYKYIEYNNYNLDHLLFSFFEIQGHHIIWGILPIFVSNVKCKIIKPSYINNIFVYALLFGILYTIIILNISNSFVNLYYYNIPYKSAILIRTIVAINIQYLFIFGFQKMITLSCLLSIVAGFLYIYSLVNFDLKIYRNDIL